MTSFAYPPAMTAQQFDPYSTDSYADFTSTSQSYQASTSMFEGPFMSTIDSFSPINAYAEMPRSQDAFRFNVDSSAAPMSNGQAAYSPAHSPAEHIPPPLHLSTSSESGASVHSTSSSAMGSPHIHPQYQPEPWNNLLPSGMPLGPQETFFASGVDQESIVANKLLGFVGESRSLDFSSQSSVAFAHSSTTVAPFPSFPSSFHGSDSSPRTSGFPILKSQTEPIASLHEHSPSSSSGQGMFKSPGLPASALQQSLSATSPLSPFHNDHRRRTLGSMDVSRPRRNSLLSNQLYPPPVTPPPEVSPTVVLSPESFKSPLSAQSSGIADVFSSSSHSFPITILRSNQFSSPATATTTQPLTRLDSADPSILNPNTFPSPIPFNYPDMNCGPSPHLLDQPPSPAPSNTSGQSQSTKVKTSPTQSPYLHTHQYHPYPYPVNRRPSSSSLHSRNSQSTGRSGSFEMDDGDRDKGLCPIPDCGRVFKDLKAHMLTHQNERPEKCPIHTCEYHTKGFARKYDKNRHTLTHYKGTMVCGFCPGSGSAAEKSFNRADVFKRHLTSLHGVEQTPPNSRKKSPSANKKSGGASQSQTAGTCSTCSVTFANPQEFYEHIDDCVLRVVQQIDPAEAINQKHLTAIAEDKQVQETLDKHHLADPVDYSAQTFDEEEDEEEDDLENDDANDTTYGSRNPRSGRGTIKANSASQHVNGSASGTNNSNRVSKVSGGRRGRTGLTYSKGGVPMHGGAGNSTSMSRSGGKKRKNYPNSWGSSAEKMKMKKRVLLVYDGPRRLWKDDMMLDAEYEVRVALPGSNGRNYVTDLDVQTMKRAEALHGATEEERGPWVPDNILDIDTVDELML